MRRKVPQLRLASRFGLVWVLPALAIVVGFWTQSPPVLALAVGLAGGLSLAGST